MWLKQANAGFSSALLDLPWLNLALACWKVYLELRAGLEVCTSARALGPAFAFFLAVLVSVLVYAHLRKSRLGFDNLLSAEIYFV